MSTTLKDMPKCDLPRERLILYGVRSLSNEELISILFRTGRRGESVKSLASDVLKIYKSLDSLKDVSLNKLKSIRGLGDVKAVTLLAAIELGRRVYDNSNLTPKVKIFSAVNAYRTFSNYIRDEKQESLLAIYLDVKNRYITHKIVFKGTLDRSQIYPRDVFKAALLENASGIIIMHNHPSGEVIPSKSDDEATCDMAEAGELIGVKLLDHIIVGRDEFYSYLEEGRLKYE